MTRLFVFHRAVARGVALAAVATATVAPLAGCTTLTPEQTTQMQYDANRRVHCQGTQDCQLKWGRALRWVLDHSAYKIATQSDLLITTLGPLPDDPRPAMTVSRTPFGEDSYEFELRLGCDNIFGCQPSLLSLQASFVRAVMDGAS